MKKNTKRIITILFLLIFVYLLYRVAVVKHKGSSRNQQTELKDSNQAPEVYMSASLKLSVVVPKKFNIEEKIISMILTSQDGKIIISRNATNFDNLSDYLQDLETKNNIITLEKEESIINNYKARISTIGYSGDEEKIKVYDVL